MSKIKKDFLMVLLRSEGIIIRMSGKGGAGMIQLPDMIYC